MKTLFHEVSCIQRPFIFDLHILYQKVLNKTNLQGILFIVYGLYLLKKINK